MSLQSIPEQSTILSPEQLSTLLDSKGNLSLLVDSAGNIQFVSAGMTRLLGHPTNLLIGNCFQSVLHAQDVDKISEVFSSVAVHGKEMPACRCRLRGVDGSYRWFDASVRDCTNIPGIEVVHALNQTANLDELLHGIHQALKNVVSAENCFVALHDPAADTFSFPFFVDQVDVAPPPPQRVGRSCTAYVFRKGAPMLIPQRDFDCLAAEGEVELVGAPSPAWLGVPLKTPTATIG